MSQELVVLARLRSDLLNAMFTKFPLALSVEKLQDSVSLAYLTRDMEWLTAAIKGELTNLNQAGLIRSSAKGYLLTDKGRRDRQQVARFMDNSNTTT
jgi:hypothetical protein